MYFKISALVLVAATCAVAELDFSESYARDSSRQFSGFAFGGRGIGSNGFDQGYGAQVASARVAPFPATSVVSNNGYGLGSQDGGLRYRSGIADGGVSRGQKTKVVQVAYQKQKASVNDDVAFKHDCHRNAGLSNVRILNNAFSSGSDGYSSGSNGFSSGSNGISSGSNVFDQGYGAQIVSAGFAPFPATSVVSNNGYGLGSQDGGLRYRSGIADGGVSRRQKTKVVQVAYQKQKASVNDDVAFKRNFNRNAGLSNVKTLNNGYSSGSNGFSSGSNVFDQGYDAQVVSPKVAPSADSSAVINPGFGIGFGLGSQDGGLRYRGGNADGGVSRGQKTKVVQVAYQKQKASVSDDLAFSRNFNRNAGFSNVRFLNNGFSSGSNGYSSGSNGYSSDSNGYSSDSNGYFSGSNGYSSDSNGYSSGSNGYSSGSNGFSSNSDVDFSAANSRRAGFANQANSAALTQSKSYNQVYSDAEDDSSSNSGSSGSVAFIPVVTSTQGSQSSESRQNKFFKTTISESNDVPNQFSVSDGRLGAVLFR